MACILAPPAGKEIALRYTSKIMHIILDLDHTLLDSVALKRKLEESIAPLGVTPEQFRDTYRATTAAIEEQYDYDIARHAQLLHEACGVDAEEVARRLHATLEGLPALVYPDSIPFLDFLRERGTPISLLTYGNATFQQEKVWLLGIASYFKNMIFTEKGKETAELHLSEPDKEWMFINDNPNEMRTLQERFPESTMLRIKRADGKQFPTEEDTLDVPTFATLDDAKQYLEKGDAH